MRNYFKVIAISVIAVLMSGITALALEFGDNSSDYANDGECDDRRFVGYGISGALDNDDTLRDANDCRRLYEAGLIKLASKKAGLAATNCDAIVYGDDGSDWARDGQCDDPRFDGPGTASIVGPSDLLRDATDCSRQCTAGRIWLRTAE